MSTPDCSTAGKKPVIAVFGSLNLDQVRQVACLPKPGETVMSLSTSQSFGGKGANQAVAAARAGGRVILCGALGNDKAGREYREHLREEGIDLYEPSPTHGLPTGEAIVLVEGSGENLIVVSSGANSAWDASTTSAILREVLPNVSLLVLQLELPLEAVLQAVREAARFGVRCLLNASPVTRGFPWGENHFDTVVVNEHEFAAFFGSDAPSLLELNREARSTFLERNCIRQLVLTRGGRPTVLMDATRSATVPVFAVRPVDTVGAGDTFTGNLAVEITLGARLEAAIRLANAAAGIATQRMGAQTAMPTRDEVTSTILSQAAPEHSLTSATAGPTLQR
jgi:ribokinase